MYNQPQTLQKHDDYHSRSLGSVIVVNLLLLVAVVPIILIATVIPITTKPILGIASLSAFILTWVLILAFGTQKLSNIFTTNINS